MNVGKGSVFLHESNSSHVVGVPGVFRFFVRNSFDVNSDQLARLISVSLFS